MKTINQEINYKKKEEKLLQIVFKKIKSIKEKRIIEMDEKNLISLEEEIKNI